MLVEHMRISYLLAVLLISHTAAGCARAPQAIGISVACGVQNQTTRHELFFGLELPDGSSIREADFESFLKTVVTPLFPDGLTVFDATGQYRTADGTSIDEATKVVVLVYPDTQEVRERVREIVTQYRARFRQESVGWVRTPACASF